MISLSLLQFFTIHILLTITSNFLRLRQKGDVDDMMRMRESGVY
jgi:hypothetical protein